MRRQTQPSDRLTLGWVLATGILAAIAPTALRAQAVPVGPEFQVNSYTTADQLNASVALRAGADFVVVWDSEGSYGTDNDFQSVQGQRFTTDGMPLGGQFQVNSYTTYIQNRPFLGLNADGDFVVVWSSIGSYGTDSDFRSVQGQRYAADGMPRGGEFQVNTYTTSAQAANSVGVSADGDFVVVWQSYGSAGTDNSSWSVQGQRYAPDGTPRGGEFQVNSYTTGLQDDPSVGVSADGDFVVVWRSNGSYGTDSDNGSVQGQRFTTDGTPLGGQFQINSYTTGPQFLPSVAVNADGDFVVVWTSLGSYGTDSDSNSIQGQRFAADATPLGDEFQINSYTTGGQSSVEVATDTNNHFVVVWLSDGSYGTDNDSFSIQGQLLATDGTPEGGEFQVNSYTTSHQRAPSVALGAGGTLVVMWESNGSDGTDNDAFSIQGQRFLVSTIFTDGFESGDTSAWSSQVPPP